MPSPTPPAQGDRLASLDALRGFDMFWIIGGARLLTEIANRINWPPLKAVADNMGEHVEWEGFHFHDMIFPLFLFIIGVSIPFSLGSRLERGDPRSRLAMRVLRRTILMFFLGLVYSGLFKFEPFDHLRIFNVLQRLALGYGFAAAIFLLTGIRGQIIACIACLVGYWAMMRFIPVPGFTQGDWSPDGNFANYIDRVVLLPGQMYEKYGDPEGLLSTIPAVASALMGVLTGHWLRSSDTPTRKALAMAGAGLAAIGLGYLWSLDIPVIKKIWTSSYALVAGGWSLLLLALFYYIIDVRGWKTWAFFFIVIGMNSITIYLGQRIIDFDGIAKFLVGGIMKHWPELATLILAAAVLTVKWLVLWFLYRKRVFLRL